MVSRKYSKIIIKNVHPRNNFINARFRINILLFLVTPLKSLKEGEALERLEDDEDILEVEEVIE